MFIVARQTYSVSCVASPVAGFLEFQNVSKEEVNIYESTKKNHAFDVSVYGGYCTIVFCFVDQICGQLPSYIILPSTA